MTPKPRGVYRTQGEVGLPNTVLLEYGTLGFNTSEQEYRDNGYQPNFDRLPWGHKYHAAKKTDDQPNRLSAFEAFCRRRTMREHQLK